MGMISFALQGNYKRYYNDLKELSKTNGKSAIVMFLDTALSTLLFGSGLQDYLNYKFYDKSFKTRRTYCTIGDMNKLYKKLANIKYAPFISDKRNFHKNYAKFVKRKCITFEDGFEKVNEFLNKNESFVLKPINGLGGGSVSKVFTKDIENREEFFNKLNTEHFFIEELIIQDESWGKISPNSINTLRIMTSAVNGKSNIIFGAVRIGNGSNFTDNFHTGGMGVLIDLEKGCLTGKGLDKKLNEYTTSVTGVKLDGLKIPYWEEIKQMVKEAALVNDNIHIVGWDVAISKNGPLLIEGNRGPGFDLVQTLLNRGTKYMLTDILKEVESSKKQVES